jgi:hypothetical protein
VAYCQTGFGQRLSAVYKASSICCSSLIVVGVSILDALLDALINESPTRWYKGNQESQLVRKGPVNEK